MMIHKPINRGISYLGFGLGGAAMVKYGDASFAFSGITLLGVVFIIAVAVIIITFRLTRTVDIVELVKAWRLNGTAKQQALPDKTEEE